jgi:transcriptional regulator with XRE-family HTH domain
MKFLESDGEHTQLLKVAQSRLVFKDAMEILGESQRGLARLLGIDHSYINKIVRGHRTPPRVLLLKLAKLVKNEIREYGL